MKPLHMISLPVNLRELRRLSAVRNFKNDEGLALHHFLSESFGKGILQPFRFMTSKKAKEATLYAYSFQDKNFLVSTAKETALPEYMSLFSLDHLNSKQMPESWKEGKKLAFEVFVRPVRRLFKPLEGWSRKKDCKPFEKGAEVDAFLIDVLRKCPEGMPSSNEERISRENSYRSWLKEKLKGAELDEKNTSIVHYERRRVFRKGVYIEGPDAIIRGHLRVTNPENFSKLLCSGIGRHVAYGYGMLLLRPAKE